MPDISKLTMPNGIEYNIKDSQARKDIEKIKKSGGGSSGGSGLPDASEYKNGTALIAIDGEFVPAEGYGYLGEEKEFHWDGKYHADEFEVIGENNYYIYLKKISDSPTESETIIVSVYTLEEEPTVFTFSKYDITSYSMYINNDSPIMIMAIYNAEDLHTETGMNLSVGTYLYIMSSESSINDGDYLIPTDGTVINDIVVSYTEGAIKIDKRLYEDSGSKVSFTQSTWSGTKIGSLTIDDNNYDLYAPNVTVNCNLTSGTQIATINGTQIYAPNVTVNRDLTSGTQIATINGTQIYAPSVPVITSGTTEYEDGVTSLANGQIYLQYEV